MLGRVNAKDKGEVAMHWIRGPLFLASAWVVLVSPRAGYAQWVPDGRALCVADSSQSLPVIVTDGSGGAIVAWQDQRNGNTDIYAQHILSTGAVDGAWPPDGRALCLAAGDQIAPVIVTDGAGGAIVVWLDQRGGDFDIYAQHILSSGAVDGAWPADGRGLCLAAGDEIAPAIATDEGGGAIVTWQDQRGGGYDIYAQHVLSTGDVDPGWPTDGRGLCLATGDQIAPTIVSDGSSGALITWQDQRSGSFDIYDHHVLSDGLPDVAWPTDGRGLCRAAGDQNAPTIITDGGGGAIVTWQDQRSGSFDIYAHHVMSNGALDVGWPTDGRALCTAMGDQVAAEMVADGHSGAIVTWQDRRSGNDDIHAQHILFNGVLDAAWPVDGRALCVAVSSQSSPTIVADGAGGAIVTWQDQRIAGNFDIFSQHVLPNGAVDGDWPVNGRELCGANQGQMVPVIVTDGAGGAIVAWQDQRGGNSDIYATRVLSCGEAAREAGCFVDGRPVCLANASQNSITIVMDGAGGAIVAWQDARGVGRDIYAQHVLSTGGVDRLWPTNGRGLCIAAAPREFPTGVSDGAGGAIVTWQDLRNGRNLDIYAQHILSTGVVDEAWPTNGLGLCVTSANQFFPAIATDGNGGAIVAWQEQEILVRADIFAHHVLANGVLDGAWPANGKAVCLVGGHQLFPEIVSDGAGGAIVLWEDHRGDNVDLYAQHILGTGALDDAWPHDGLAVCLASGNQQSSTIISDGAGGAIVTWQDYRNGASNPDIYAQHVLPTGVVDGAWPSDGRVLCLAAGIQDSPDIVTDGAGGAIVTWRDDRGGMGSNIYAQHVLSDGALDAAWPPDGLALCLAGGVQDSPMIETDASGGAIVTWRDHRSGMGSDIYAQHVLSSGAVDGAWTTDGLALCLAAGDQRFPVLVTDGAGGATVAWQDGRSRNNDDVYSQRVLSSGTILAAPPVTGKDVAPALAWPNPFTSRVFIAFSLEAAAPVRLEVFDVGGRLVWMSSTRFLSPGRHTMAWDGEAKERGLQAEGIYFLRVRGPRIAVSRTVVRVK